ncbi:MAG: DUF4258 domain-containing protein [Gammaproteobacteria bacterium]
MRSGAPVSPGRRSRPWWSGACCGWIGGLQPRWPDHRTDRPYPSCLILYVEAEPVHVVAAADPIARICHVITAYRPDLEHFEPDFKTRKRKTS